MVDLAQPAAEPFDATTTAAALQAVGVADYVRQSIEEPNAVLVSGYQGDVMPNTYGKTLSDQQLDALVQYLVDGQKGSK